MVYKVHWLSMVENCTHGIRLQLGIPLSLMSHGRKHHFWPRSETKVLLGETHCNFSNADSNAIKWTTRAYGKPYHLSHA